jgi:DNA polymerase-3 subunit alpha
MKIDQYGQVHYSIREVLEILYHRPDFDLTQISIEKTACEKFNKHSQNLLDDMIALSNHNSLTENIEDFHEMKLNTWFMPDTYKELDIEKFVLDQCQNAEETKRVNDELMLYKSRNLINVLKYIKYVVDTMRKNKIVWGVGRGSSLASFVLFLIGINKVNPMDHDLDIHDFLR